MDLNEELVDDGKILDSLRPGRQLLGVAVGQTTSGVLDLDEEVGQPEYHRRTEPDKGPEKTIKLEAEA